MVTVKGTPIDAPLYEMDEARGVEYWGCRAVVAGFTVAGDVSSLVPRGLHLDTPAVGAVLIADYGASTLGPYGEFVSILRVVDDDGQPGFYVPYIYVTDDAALAAGREVLGAPKKLAAISLEARSGTVVGTLGRPAGTALCEVAVVPSQRLPAEIADLLVPAGTPMYSLRHLPAGFGGAAVHELVQWNCDLAIHSDRFGDELRFTGPASVTYPTATAVDPVHRLAVDTMIGAGYIEFDMRLTAGRTVWSETVTMPERAAVPATA